MQDTWMPSLENWDGRLKVCQERGGREGGRE